MSATTLSIKRTQSSLHDDHGFDWIGLFACTLIITSFGLLAGGWGLLVGVLTLIMWWFLGIPVAIATGHVMLPIVFSGLPTIPELVLLESGFVLLLLASLWPTTAPVRLLALMTGTLGVLGSIFLITWVYWPLLASALTTMLAIAVAVYLVQRDAIVRLGEVPPRE